MMSSFTCEWTYDVFLNFRGEDTRYNFTGNLYNSLRQKGILTFIDDEGLRRGEEITPALLRAIQESRIAILVFSKNYASSKFCLDELVKILECLPAPGRLVLPIFYDVDPRQVRHQTGTYAEALAKHEERLHDDKDKVQQWKNALTQAANLSGLPFHLGSQSEYKFIEKIVEEVSKKIAYTPLHVVDHPVGLESPVLKVKSLLGLWSDVDMVGIYGIGGIGKTTIARAVYNLIADRFEGSCFLVDIREKANKHGLVQLQETLLFEVFGEKDIKVGDVNRGIPIIKRRLQQKKVLLILDDVDKLQQLRVLAGGYDWFGSGSKIIITTRDKQLLANHGVIKLHEVEQLNDEMALELFSWHAFKSNKVDQGCVDISKRAVFYACGLPLALEVIGSHLFGKSLDECNSALDKYERIPHRDIYEILKVSYDGLEDEEKGIFLDIACFFNTYKMVYVKEMLRAHGFHAEYGILVLSDRSLIKIDASGRVRMHDLIQDMGREIVMRESILEPGERSRLWLDEDVIHVLEENTGTDKTEAIMLKACDSKGVQWSGKAFEKMKNLRILIIGDATFSSGPQYLPNSLRALDWSGYPSLSLPSDFNPKGLLILNLPESCVKFLQPFKRFESLRLINFEDCKFLTELPSLHEVPFLETLCLDDCTNLAKIHDSVGFLDNLFSLSAKGCIELKILVPCIKLTSLEILDLTRCSRLKSFPEVLVKMDKIRDIYLDETDIKKLPLSIGNLVGLERLYLRRCRRLNQLPGSIHTLPKVEVIMSYRQRGFRCFERCEEKESSKLSPNAMVVYYRRMDLTHLDVYYPYISPSNAIQVCSPNPHVIPEIEYLFQGLERRRHMDWFKVESKKPSMCFWFRKKFPKIALCCCGKSPESIDKMPLDFQFSVVINGTKQFSCSCNYISTWHPVSYSQVFWCDLQCKEEEGVFSKHEWNQVDISCELKCLTPCGSKREMATEDAMWTLLCVYEEGNSKEDIDFKNIMSYVPHSDPRPVSSCSFPGCLYYHEQLFKCRLKRSSYTQLPEPKERERERESDKWNMET